MARTPLKKAFFVVVDYLKKRGEATKMEIVEGTGLSWETVTKVLDVLEELGTVVLEKRGKRVIVKLTTSFDTSETYFSVGLPPNILETLKGLYGTIQEVWRKIAGRNPRPVEVQKTAVKIIEEFGLNLPSGRYLYGVITPLRYTEGKKYPKLEGELGKKAEKLAVWMAKKYRDAPPWKIVEDQHREKDIEDYYRYLSMLEAAQSKEEMLKAIKGLIQEVKSERSSEMLSRLYGAVYSFYSPKNPLLKALKSEVVEYVKIEEFRHDLASSGVPSSGLAYIEVILMESEETVEELLLSLAPA